jgi:alpha-1,6-mannosyltransferase
VRIVHVANAYAPRSGGIRTTVHALGRGYGAAGHELVLVVPGAGAADEVLPWGRRLTLPGPWVPGTGGYRVLADARRVRTVLDHLEPVGLEVSDRLTLRRLGPWARTAGVPSVVIAHERVDGVVAAFTPLGDRASRSVADWHNLTTAGLFDDVVTTTRFAAQEFARIGVPIHHVPLGVDLEAFVPARTGSGVESAPRRPLLVLCSRLSREKRPDLAVEALRVLHGRGCRARLVVAGAGPVAGALRRRSSGLPVTMLGHLPERAAVARLLASADVVLAPGPIETFGLAALEALACGTPVVAANTSAVAELVETGAGRVAAPDPHSLADAILSVLSEPEARRRARARARAEEFGWARTTDAMLALHGPHRLHREQAIPAIRP